MNWPAGWSTTFLGRDDCDLRIAGSATNAIARIQPHIVINAAAYTAVDKAEQEKTAAFILNADAPAEMAVATAAMNIPLIHISTDYVFEGTNARPYTEADTCAPLSIYGASKLAGEISIRKHNPCHIILRTSWIFSSHGANFVRTMLALGGQRKDLGVVVDQVGGPTAADDIARTLVQLAQQLVKGSSLYGTYHYSGAPFISWHGFAMAIFDKAAAREMGVPINLREITNAQYPTVAPRPLNSRLDCGKIEREWGIKRPSWETALDRCLNILTMPTSV